MPGSATAHSTQGPCCSRPSRTGRRGPVSPGPGRACRSALVTSSDTTIAMSWLLCAVPHRRNVATVKSRAARTDPACAPRARVAIRGGQAQPTAAGSGGDRQLPPARPAISAAGISQRQPVPPVGCDGCAAITARSTSVRHGNRRQVRTAFRTTAAGTEVLTGAIPAPAALTVSDAARPPVLTGQVVTARAADANRLQLRELVERLHRNPQAFSVHEHQVLDRIVRTNWMIEHDDDAIITAVTRAVEVATDAHADVVDRLLRQCDAAVAERDRAGAERDAARRRVKQLEDEMMGDLFRTADEARMSGLPVLLVHRVFQSAV